ncbi:hypothetical protein [Kordiimonas sp.]|uniref:hypothetical protein n=1 Tax=Kordiimonas sp. TaxID=1970157 RepID=UPI003A94D56A
MKPSDIRDFLINREAVLVHFSTMMASDPSRYFPHDMNNAMSLTGVGLAFSTIQKGGRFDPTDTGKSGAEGGVGIVVDIAPTTHVLKVHPSDMGSSPYGGTASGLGVPPMPLACANSIDSRLRSNEWLVQDYKVVGIFVLPPLLVRLPIPGLVPESYIESKITVGAVANHFFPHHRIYSANTQTFIEFDRASRTWQDVGILDIYP